MNGQNYHVCYAPVPGTHASLALVCLDKEILTDYNRLLYIAIVVVIVGLLLVLLITTRLVRHNIKPIERLLEATQKIADGNFDDEIPVSEGKDVVSQLQNNFAAMQQSLLEHRKSIEQTTEDIKRENEALEQAMQQVEESAKEKQLFIQNILRNICKPLNIIEGLSNMLLNGLSSRDKHAGALTGLSQSGPVDHQEIRNITNTMKHNAVQLNRMAHMLYDSSMTEEEGQTLYQRNDDVLCNEVVRESIDYTQANYPSAEMRLETELPDSMSIRSNRMYILRSMREILFNAAKYSDGKHITIRLTRTDDTVRFTVEDVGPGLPKDWQEVVSQPFLKVEEQSEGLGLGLPLTQRHMAGLGGEFIYDADYQQGCRVILELPKKETNEVGA